MADLRTEKARESVCVLVDADNQFLDATETLLLSEGVRVLGKASSGLGALQLLEAQPLTAVVVDLRLPDLDGLDVGRRMAEIVRRKTAVIIYTSHADEQVVAAALDAGVRAIVLKDGAPNNLLAAIAAVAMGGTYVDPQLRADETSARS
jgi:DNA-binding NarL/FixJ family response regulator